MKKLTREFTIRQTCQGEKENFVGILDSSPSIRLFSLPRMTMTIVVMITLSRIQVNVWQKMIASTACVITLEKTTVDCNAGLLAAVNINVQGTHAGQCAKLEAVVLTELQLQPYH